MRPLMLVLVLFLGACAYREAESVRNDYVGSVIVEDLAARWYAELPAVEAWVARRTNYSVNVRPPTIRVVTPDELARNHAPYVQGSSGRLLLAAYSFELETIFIRDDLMPEADRWLLLHEYIHHLQRVYGVRYRCLAEAESEAYSLENEYRREVGQWRGFQHTPQFIAEMSRCAGRTRSRRQPLRFLAEGFA
jgi:hypothetical protein